MIRIFIFFTVFVTAQLAAQIQVDTITQLRAPITESSGLLLINGAFITHNDSDNDPVLYQIDTLTGYAQRTVFIENASNRDWEDLAVDQAYLYIGDIGNNQGSRQDLCIYKVALSDFWAGDTVTADTIAFSYADQSSFTPMPFQTNFDAEGLVARGDSLYVFTKQWGNAGTRGYAIPKAPGNYTVNATVALPLASGLVTGADYLSDYVPGINLLALTINQIGSPRINFYLDQGGAFGTGGHYSFGTSVYGSIQVEAISITPNNFYITAEQFGNQLGFLSSATIPPFMAINEQIGIVPVTLFPNPGRQKFAVMMPNGAAIKNIAVYNAQGQAVNLDCPIIGDHQFVINQPPGVYMVMLLFTDGRRGLEQLIITE